MTSIDNWWAILARYSNREDLLDPLVRVLERIAANDQTIEPGVQSAEPKPVGAAKLTSKDQQQLIAVFYAGTAKWKLAEQYGISESTVKRLIREDRKRTVNELPTS